MFSWFGKKKAVAKPQPAMKGSEPQALSRAIDKPPPEIVRGKVAFSSAQKSWTEEFDVVTIAADALSQEGRFVSRTDDTLTLDTSEYTISPVMVSFKPLDNGRGSQSCTVIRIRHPRLIPDQIFEFQHSVGSTLTESLSRGFSDWARTDLVALLEAIETNPQRCTTLEMSIPARNGHPELNRRIILGPVVHLQQNKPDVTDPSQHPPFCPCCLLTNSMQTFMPIIESDGFFGVRLFAMRNADESASADCRINGQEFEDGKSALRDYVQKWLSMGVEYRKQYVVVQNRPA